MSNSVFQSVEYEATPKTRRPKLLIVEDDTGFLKTLSVEFHEKGYEILEAERLDRLAKLDLTDLSFSIIDLRIGQENGLDVLTTIRTASPDCRAVILTGYGSIATAIKAVKMGAVNYLTKPVSIEVLEKALWMELSDESALLPKKTLSLAKHEREYIDFVLAQCGGNISKAAEWLGLHRQSLQRKLRKYPPRN